MELDKRIIDGKKPLDCFDTKIAKQFIGKKGYFSHYIDNYADLKNTILGTLGSTGDTYHESFCCTEQPFDNYYYEFFIPEDWVKSPEVKYEPYTLCTWEQDFKFGDELLIRVKDEESDYMYKGIYNGWSCKDRKILISMGTWLFTFDEFFLLHEIYRNGNWEPFGKKIEE